MNPKELASELYFPIKLGKSFFRKLSFCLFGFLIMILMYYYYENGLESYYQYIIFFGGIFLSISSLIVTLILVFPSLFKPAFVIDGDMVRLEPHKISIPFEDLGPAWLSLEKPLLPAWVYWRRQYYLTLTIRNSTHYQALAPNWFLRRQLRGTAKPKKPLKENQYYNWHLSRSC